MESMKKFRDDVAPMEPVVENTGIRLRTYQTEMLEESLKANIIVVQDTGSGKTHIALARTAAELELCDPSKLVWFLAPTVALCEQQLKVFQSNLPAFEIQSLSGRDDVDNWRDQSTWDAVLANVRIVLSTPQVLLDALTHGFIKMRRLALLIFDEAHRTSPETSAAYTKYANIIDCTGKHPANTILANFYLPKVHEDADLPRILGLSASPVMKAKASIQVLGEIERNMNSVTKTPKVHRSELLRHAHRPELIQIEYPLVSCGHSLLYTSLKSVLTNYDISRDPYVIDLLSNPNKYYNVAQRLEEAYCKQCTYCLEELKSLVAKYETTAAELGFSVADWCLQQCIAQFQKQVRSPDQLLDWSNAEKQYLQEIFDRLPLPRDYASQPMSLDNLSPKVVALIDLLTSEASPSLSGLVFVEQRVWVAAIAELLSFHPKLQGRLSVGTFVGSSASPKRKFKIATMVEPKNQQDTLDRFRAGDTNLVIATSVLEEGIDVSECHLVISFQSPKNLKSFVQRRGRARRVQSKYIIFSPIEGAGQAPMPWEKLEKEMKDAYEDDLRHVKEAEQSESVVEMGERFHEVPNTGALLTLDNAVPHLYHFCALLASGPYVDTRPQFGFEEDSGNIAAEVTLPLSVDPTLRVTHSLKAWRTERMAMKDAAFESYKMLHQNGLVNDNLLPIKEEEDTLAAEFQKSDKTASLIEVSPPLDPWRFIAGCQERNAHAYHGTMLEFRGLQEQPFYLAFYLPVQLPAMSDLTLFWNESTRITIVSHRLPETILSTEEINTMRDITRKILVSVHGKRIENTRNDFLWLLVPSDASGLPWNHTRLLQWEVETSLVRPASELIRQSKIKLEEWGQVRVQGDERKWLLRYINLDTVDPASESTPNLHLTRVPKRRDFVYPVPHSQRENEAYTRTEEFPVSDCSVEMLPVGYSICAMLIPSILYRYETYLTTNSLRLGLLAPVSFEIEHLPLLVQAMTSSSTGDVAHYQRFEFFGDCIVKFIASVHLMASNLKWPESFLTGKKGKIVSNGFFARATLSAGLDKFIIRKRFKAAKWKPRYANDVLSGSPPVEQTTMSSKVLADVIESLVGTSYIIGGFPKALICMQTLLPLEKWTPLPESNQILYDAVPTNLDITSLTTVEKLIGYTFRKKMALLEALTHSSYKGPLANCSYERLEFLGDAVLDYIISKRLFAHSPEIGHAKMHGIRTAMANAAFLAFRMFETTVEEERTVPPDMHKEVRHRCLWQFLRSDAAALVVGRDAAIQQYDGAKERIRAALQHDGVFPWHILALTDSPKFLSDIVESVIGAIYVDSCGDIGACEVFVRKLGILDCLERILDDGVDCLHPKERLGILAVEKDVQYVRVITEGAEKGYTCQIKVGGMDIGGVVTGVKRLNAETIAAWEACKILEAHKNRATEGGVEMKEAEIEERDGYEGEGEGEDEWFDAEEGEV